MLIKYTNSINSYRSGKELPSFNFLCYKPDFKICRFDPYTSKSSNKKKEVRKNPGYLEFFSFNLYDLHKFLWNYKQSPKLIRDLRN